MSNSTTMQELKQENEINLCDSCCNQYPECNPKYIIFGTGIGNDNIAACNIYGPITLKDCEEMSEAESEAWDNER